MQIKYHYMINRETFKAHYSDFDKDIVLDILDMFITDYNQKISRLSKGINQNDPELLKKDAHSFMGILGNIEANCLAFEQIARIEELAEGLTDDEENNKELKKAKYDELRKQFVLFKHSSSQLLNDAKELRKHYLDQ